MNKKAIIIIGPQGSGKTTKMEEITKGKRKIIQYADQPFVPGDPNDFPDYMVFEEVKKLNDPFFSRLFLLGIQVSSAITILIGQQKLEDLPSAFFSPDIEIINLHRPN